MENSLQLTRELFLECNWIYDISLEDHHGYSSLMRSLQGFAKKLSEQGKLESSQAFDLLAQAASMRLEASSINEPFKAFWEDFQAAQRSTIPDDFTEKELIFFEEILDDSNDPWLKARIADLLWLVKTPKNPKHAQIAIDSYISHPINDATWHQDINGCWERAARLSMQIKDFERLNTIKSSLFSAFCSEYPKSKFMIFWIAELLGKLRIDNDFIEDIASSLSKKAHDLKGNNDFYSAISYFDLASKKHKQCSNHKEWLDSLIALAECFELDGDSRSGDSNLVANSFCENAIQVYRRIPAKYREAYSIEERLRVIREKIVTSGKASLDEMKMVSTPGIDISGVVKQSIEHVSGKGSAGDALMYFSGISSQPKYQELRDRAKGVMGRSLFASLFGSRRISRDGRVIANTPAMNLGAGEEDSANRAAIHRQVLQDFSIQTQLVVEGQILPALRQLIMEHRFTKEFMIAVCRQAPIVQEGREELFGYALWLGFEHEFGVAAHLICPQIEHVVRSNLKEAGAHTSNIDKNGIENENGLSTLMDLPEALELYGENLVFEIKSVFTDALCFNLRNQVAHGLLGDQDAWSISAIYAWWMALRLVIQSIVDGSSRSNVENP